MAENATYAGLDDEGKDEEKRAEAEAKKAKAAAEIAAVKARKEARRQKMIKEQREMLTPKLASAKWEEVVVHSSDKTRVKFEITSKGVFLYEIKDGHGMECEMRFFPYNALDGEFIQRDLGKVKTKKGELICNEAGTVGFLFSNSSWFSKKKCQIKYVHASRHLDKSVLKKHEEKYDPQDVWWVRRDPATRKVYYINKAMRKTSWHLPAGAHLANGRFAFKREGVEDDEDGEEQKVHGNEYQQKMNSITTEDDVENLPPPLMGWFVKANRKGAMQKRLLRLERQYLHYYLDEDALRKGKELKKPMNMYEIIGAKVPSDNPGFEDHEMNDVHDCPFDIYTRDKTLCLVPAPHQEDLDQARKLARVLKTWKPRMKSGWFMKVNRKGKAQKRWFILKGHRLSYFSDPHDDKNKKAPIDLEFLDSIIEPSERVENASTNGAFDLIIAPNGPDAPEVPQTMKEKKRIMEEDAKKEKKGKDEATLVFSTITIYPAQMDPGTKDLMDTLKDWQTHDELRYNKGKFTILECQVHASHVVSFGVVVTDVPPLAIDTGWEGHTEPGVRITGLTRLPNGNLGPAEEAGVMLNDWLISVDGEEVHCVQDAAKALRDKQVGVWKLCRMGEVLPEQVARMKRSMLTKEEKEIAEKKAKKQEEVRKRKEKEAEMAAGKTEHGHRHHLSNKAMFGARKVRSGWRSASTPNGKPYWYHTNGKTSQKKPAASEIID